LKSVLDQLDSGVGVAADDDFDHVKSKENVRIVQKAQPGQSAPRNALLFLPVYCFDRPAKIFAAARFHFHENKRVLIAADDIDFAAAASAKVAVENFVAFSAQKPAGNFFATRSLSKMFR
jgi:hypothetical protein